MSRTATEQRPEEILDNIVLYLTRHGIGELSLRPLAKAVGSSPRVLLYYFGSKEQMIGKVLQELRRRQRDFYQQIEAATLAEACAAVWKHMTTSDSEAFFHLFFEAYGMALRQPRRHKEFLSATIEDWLEFVAGFLRGEGHERTEARTLATILLAGFRGFMLDYCTTHDRKRLDRAVALWLRTLDPMLSGGRSS